MNGNDDNWSGRQGSGQQGHDQHYQDPPYQQGSWGGSGFDDDYQEDDQYTVARFPNQAQQYNEPQYSGRGGQQDRGGSEWDYTSQDEYQVGATKSNGLLIFAIAAFFAALIGVGYAIYRVLDEDSPTTADSAATDTSEGSISEGSTETTVGTDTTTTLPLTDPANMLTVSLTTDQINCDSATHRFGTVSGATPGEAIQFQSPQTSAIGDGTADENGEIGIQWNCTSEQVGTTWEVTATGATSGKSAVLVFTGVPAGTVTTEPTTDTSGGTGISANVFENPFVCNGESREFATITGLTPSAEIQFSSPEATGLRPGTAKEDGTLNPRWSCTADQVGQTWNLTATDSVTGEAVTLTFTGG